MIQAQEQYDSFQGIPPSCLGAMMEGYARAAVRTARREYGRRLDFTADSLELLDEILILVSENPTVDLEQQIRIWGGYFGEVLRRRYAGSWEMSPYPGAAEPLPSVEARGYRLFPLAKVYRRLTMGDEEDLGSYFLRIASRVGQPARLN